MSLDPARWREWPRLFLPGVAARPGDPVRLPSEEWNKLFRVLRLPLGSVVALLPNDGTLWGCRLDDHVLLPEVRLTPPTNLAFSLTLALGLPRPEPLEDAVRMASELGVTGFHLFPSDRTVVKWDEAKRASRQERLATIAREAAEVSGRTRLPEWQWSSRLGLLLEHVPSAIVLSESEGLPRTLEDALDELEPGAAMTLVVGPEGGWSPAERALIGARAVTLGAPVLRVSTAAAAAVARTLAHRRQGLRAS